MSNGTWQLQTCIAIVVIFCVVIGLATSNTFALIAGGLFAGLLIPVRSPRLVVARTVLALLIACTAYALLGGR